KAKCPFHNEKTPSFFVSPDRGSYYCFGCGVKGDIFTFVQEFEGLDFRGALKVLAERAGIDLKDFKSENKVEDDTTPLYKALEVATTFFGNVLTNSPEPLAYLAKRGLTKKTIEDWRLGFVRDEWRSLHTHLTSQGVSDIVAEKSGLIKRSDESVYDRFRGRIMFPITDSSGRVIAFTGRILHDDGKSGKYVNSPETVLFHKSKTLYGLHKAKYSIRRQDYSILVEGQVDLIMSHQAGFTNTVASSGTALTKEHLEMLRRLSNRIVMAFDADKAGFNAAARAWVLALALGMEVKIAELPKGFDPADLILKDKEKWVEALKNTKHIIDFFLGKIIAESKDNRTLSMSLKKEVLPYVSALTSMSEKTHFIQKIAHASGIPETAWWQDLNSMPADQLLQVKDIAPVVVNTVKQSITPRLGTIERHLTSIALWQESIKDGRIAVDDLWKKLEILFGTEKITVLRNLSKEDCQKLIFEAEMHYGSHEHLDKDIDELLLHGEEETLKDSLALEMQKYAQAHRGKQSEEMEESLKRSQELSKRIGEVAKRKKQKHN
ncbi:MAG: DNA primase, partial [Candidatus Paceibacterota bacterium]